MLFSTEGKSILMNRFRQKKPLENWQVELMPYYEFVFIYGVSLCENCADSVIFSSNHPQYSDGWWFDEARAMKSKGWVVPETLHAFCQSCAKEHNVSHNPKAYTLTEL